MQDGYRIFGNGKSSKTTNKNQHHKFPSGLGFPKPEGKDEGESYTLFRTLLFYHKLNGHDGNGRPDGFTRSEAEQLRGAFLDLAERLRKTAEQLEF